jgi:hypothetical protein
MSKPFTNRQYKAINCLKLFFLLAFLGDAHYSIAQVQPPTNFNNPTSEPTTDFRCSHQTLGRSKELIIPISNQSNGGVNAPPCVPSEILAQMTTNVLVEYLKSKKEYACLSGVFFAPYVAALYKKDNLDAVITAIEKAEGSYDGTYTNGYYGLLSYLHSAVFHNSKSGSNIIDAAMEARIASATDIICKNPNLLKLKEVDLSNVALNTYEKVDVLNLQSSNILEEFLIILADLDSTRTRPESLKLVKTIFNNITIHKNTTWNKPIKSNMDWYQGYWRAFILYENMINDTEFVNIPANLNSITAITTLLGNIALDTMLKNTATTSEGRKKDISSNWLKNAVIELKKTTELQQPIAI